MSTKKAGCDGAPGAAESALRICVETFIACRVTKSTLRLPRELFASTLHSFLAVLVDMTGADRIKQIAID